MEQVSTLQLFHGLLRLEIHATNGTRKETDVRGASFRRRIHIERTIQFD